MKLGIPATKILDFDVEARPLAWYGGDFVTKQPTAIAYKIVGDSGPPSCFLLGASHEPDNLRDEEIEMIETFRKAYDSAAVVTGHFIKSFDLTVLNGACMRLGIPGFGPKHCSDTKLDLDKASGLSKSMESLGAMFELNHPKVVMNTTLWAEANMLTTKGMEFTRTRVVGDVEEHLELRERMIELDILAAPKLWRPRSSGGGSRYIP